jgi:hypothetical protein
MIIMVKRGFLGGQKTMSFGEFFNENKVITLNEILNWDDVVDNIKDLKVKNQVIGQGVLFGHEYPSDTPITEGGDNENV